MGVPSATVPESSNPVPGVVKDAPRVRGAAGKLKKSPGNGAGQETRAGAAPQSICRRPSACWKGVGAFSVPNALRKSSTTPWIAAASAPAPLHVVSSTADTSLAKAGDAGGG